ncbi:MAG: tyrosine-type recombinase/integrase [Thermodesulfobacteriota bacterium]
MSVFSVKGKSWRYDFVLSGMRYTQAGFKNKREARQAEATRREEIQNPKIQTEEPAIPTDMAFLDLVNHRLDYVKAYNSERHYSDHIYLAKRWIKQWGKCKCGDITPASIQEFLLKRFRKTSGYTANKDLRMLRALFNFAMHPTREWMQRNPTRGIAFFPVEKKIKYVPPKEDVLKVISAADTDTQDYLWTIALTMGRMSEINRLTWQDVNLETRSVILYTRKKRGGHLTPRKIPMCGSLYDIMRRRYENRDGMKPWVFWHRYFDRKSRSWIDKRYKDRSQIMRYLCDKAGVRYFRFHALRHFGASMLDQENIPIGSIQRILGHENRTTTEIYLHSIGNAERDAMSVFDRHFSGDVSKKVPHQVPHQQNGVCPTTL